MNIIGQVVSTASAEVTRAPQNRWLDQDDRAGNNEEEEDTP